MPEREGAVEKMGEGMDDGGEGKAEKLIVLSAIPEALVSREGLDAWREGCSKSCWLGSSAIEYVAPGSVGAYIIMRVSGGDWACPEYGIRERKTGTAKEGGGK